GGGPGRGGAGARRARGARLHRGRGPRDQELAVAAARRLAARGHRPAGGLPGVGVAVRSRVRDARRRQGAGQAHAAAPGAAAARGGAGGRHRRRPARRHPGLGPGSALMALTGRAALVAALGIVVVLIAPQPAPALLGVCLLLAAGIVLDLALAGSVRPLRFHRAGDRLVRLGQSATVELTVENPGRRRVRGVLRDAWPPSAGAAPREVPLDVPAGERRKVVVTLTPARRGDRESVAVTVRARGPLGLAARQGSHRSPWSVRVLPPFLSRKHLPSRLARLRELEG